MFKGEFQSRRRVDLRGRSRNELTKEEELLRLRREREARKRRQLELTSCTRLQNAWRAWVVRRDVREGLRCEWRELYGAEGTGFHRGVFAWDVVSRVVYFVDPSRPEDVASFAVVCHTLISIFRIERRHSCRKDGGSGWGCGVEGGMGKVAVDEMAVYRMELVVEKCFRILDHQTRAWASLMLSPGSQGVEENHAFRSIAEFILMALQLPVWGRDDPAGSGNQVSCHIARRLLQKGVLNKLGHILIGSMEETGLESMEGTCLEQIVVSAVALVSSHLEVGESTALGAFQLLSIHSLASISPQLAAHGQALLLTSLPLMQQLATEEIPVDAMAKVNISGDQLHKMCIDVFLNLIQVVPPSLAAMAEKKDARLYHVTASVVEFMTWVIQQNLQSDPQDAEEMGEEDWRSTSDPSSSFHPTSEFREAAETLQGPQGQQLVLALTDPLFSEENLDPHSLASICELLLFVIQGTSDDSHLHGMLLTFALSGRLVHRLWHGCIEKAWNVPDASFPDQLLTETLLAPLIIFCEVYSAFLSTASEEEVCQKQIPLALRDIYDPEHPEGGLITVLKKCLWQVAWVKPSIASGTPGPDLRSAMVSSFPRICGRLLLQLHDNSARWDLAPSSHFHVQSAQLVQFVSEASSASPRVVGNGNSEAGFNRTSVLLTHASCLIPFQDRARIFQAYVDLDRHRFQSHMSSFVSRTNVHARVRRLQLLEDGFDQLGKLNARALKGRLRVEFVDEHGMVEAGVDGGGLFKDFIEEIVKKGFDPQYGFFTATEQQEIYPNPSAIVLQPDALQIISFLGRMTGKAVYDGILLELPLAHFFLKKFQGLMCDLHDLPSLDPDVYSNLIQLKSQKHNLEAMGLHFTITDNVYGQNAEIELKPNGRNIPVTQHNVLSYMHHFAHYRLNKEVSATSNAFLRGFFDIIQRDWVQMFNAMELKMLISGSHQGLDISNMRRYAQYAGGYHEEHPVIHSFWEVMEEMTIEEQRHFLKFVTGCSRAPLLGFAQLQPKMCIQMAGNVLDDHSTERLPTSSTCLNLLKLPPYASKEVMQQKLRYAISSKTGFHLS